MNCFTSLIATLLCAIFLSCQPKKEEVSKPNVLWIVSEDNSPFLGAYGDDYATTPNLDALAAKGIL